MKNIYSWCATVTYSHSGFITSTQIYCKTLFTIITWLVQFVNFNVYNINVKKKNFNMTLLFVRKSPVWDCVQDEHIVAIFFMLSYLDVLAGDVLHNGRKQLRWILPHGDELSTKQTAKQLHPLAVSLFSSSVTAEGETQRESFPMMHSPRRSFSWPPVWETPCCSPTSP